MSMTVQEIAVSLIRADPRAQPRAVVLPEKITEYRDEMAAGDVFPPVVVFREGDVYWLADGFHRFGGAQALGAETILCEVHEGELRDAILYSCGANAAHGLKRSNEDKRRAVMRLLEDEEWSRWSDREIGRRIGVSNDFVSRLRSSLSSKDSEPRTYTTKHGTNARMNTAAIGKSRAAHKPDAPKSDPAPVAPSTELDLPVPGATTPTAPAEPSNVISLAPHLPFLPSEDECERQVAADETAEREHGAEEFDLGNVEHRANAINGALNTFDFVPITGTEYWQVYGHSPARETFIVWAMKAHEAITDILKVHDDVLLQSTTESRSGRKGRSRPSR